MPPLEIHLDIRHALDPVAFASDRLGLHADPTQAVVLRSRSNQVILNCCRQWGKSTATGVRAVHTAWHHPESLILVVSVTARQSGELVRKCAAFLRRLGVSPKTDGMNRVSLLLPNGSRIVGLPGSEANVRGFSGARMLLVDEASRVPEDLYHAMLPVLAASGGDLWLMSTPFGRLGFFFETWTSGGADWHRIRVPATECARISPESLARAQKSMPDRVFRQEYLCEFSDSDETVFSQSQIRRSITYDIRPLF